MKTLSTAILIGVGLLNLYPLIGVLSADQITQLYGLDLASTDHAILMRHRAVLFGLLGLFIVYSAVERSQRLLACVAGLVSMVSFVLLAYASGNVGGKLHTVVVADIAGSIALAVVLFQQLKNRPVDKGTS